MEINLTALKLIIFDLDDTLINNRMVDYHSFVDVLIKFGLEPIKPVDLYALRKQGLSADELLATLIDSDLAKLYKQVQLARRRLLNSGVLWRRYAKPFPQVKKLLQQLKNDGLSIAIVTIRRDHALITQLLDSFQLGQLVDFLYCRDDYASFAKARQSSGYWYNLKVAGYKTSLSKFGVSQETALVIGDDPSDIEAALASNISVIRVRNAYKDLAFVGLGKKIKTVASVAYLRRFLK